MALEVSMLPEVHEDDIFTDEGEADRYRDLREQVDEVAYLVVSHAGKFYVVGSGTKDDPRE